MTVDLAELVTRLSLEQKITLLTGASTWTFAAEPTVGLSSIMVSDGPTGVRGPAMDDRDPSASLPSATAIAASWDLNRVWRLGKLIAAEARKKGVSVVLGPTINLQRSPAGGRHFEAYSEDPWLTGEIAAAYIESLQAEGVAATPKHYVANDSETERESVNVLVDERTLRELYLAPFERAVGAGAWLIMSSYNKINGVHAASNDLLRTPLKSEWDFDGVVVSDWNGVKDTIPSANAAQDLVMPGPDGPWGAALLTAVRAGEVAESAIDEKVERLLRLASRVGALEGAPAPKEVPVWSDTDTADLLREAAADGMVLIRNNGVLPIEKTRKVAVIGQHARRGRGQGGGSAMVFPAVENSPWNGISASFPDATYVPALPPVAELRPFGRAVLTTPDGEHGTLVRYFDESDVNFASETFPSGRFGWLFAPELARSKRIEFRTTYTAEESGSLRIGFAGLGTAVLRIDGKTVLDEEIAMAGDDLVSGVLNPPTRTVEVELEARQRVQLELDLVPFLPGGFPFGLVSLGTDSVFGDPAIELQRGIDAARDADVAIVVVGTSEAIESEGFDRPSLSLPEGQDDLVRRIAEANDRTIVVVNSGAPVLMPWIDDVAAVLLTWFPGQEFGGALADVLSGTVEPGGRMTTTWARAQEDVPVWDTIPVHGALTYSEGLHIGYRGWAKRPDGPTPLAAFGSGLGYTQWRISNESVLHDGSGARATATLTNIGDRPGKQVVQAFVSRLDESKIERPALWLAGFATVHSDAGAQTAISIEIPERAFQYWSTDDHAWVAEPGRYGVRLGAGIDALGDELIVTID